MSQVPDKTLITNCAQWCTCCGKRFTKEEVENVSECPKCHTTGIPCDPNQDFKIEINWHELRILTIWASNWASEKAFDKQSKSSLNGIIGRLQRQNPNGAPLTIAGELTDLRKMLREQGHDKASVEYNGTVDQGLVVVHGPGAVGFSKSLEELNAIPK